MRANLVMGTAESKGSHRHRSGKHPRHKHEVSTTHKCQHKNKQVETLMSGNRKLSKGKNETIVPLITSSPLNPSLQGSILNYSFPMQRSISEIQLIPHQPPHNETSRNPNQTDMNDTQGVYDYKKDMQRVDEENRPVLEGLCPDKMYVSTNDLRICDTQRLPPPLRCKITQGFFRPIPPPQFYHKNTTFNPQFL